MTLYQEDYRLKKAKKLIESLEGEDGDLIRYYIKKKDNHIDDLNERINEFREACSIIGKYIPYKGPTKFG